jgi:hypothetical protein
MIKGINKTLLCFILQKNKKKREGVVGRKR